MPELGKKNVTMVPLGAVMLAGLNVNVSSKPTLTLMCPGVLAGAVGTAAAADEDDEEDPAAGAGAPYCAATKAGRATSARDVVKIMVLWRWRLNSGRKSAEADSKMNGPSYRVWQQLRKVELQLRSFPPALLQCGAFLSVADLLGH